MRSSQRRVARAGILTAALVGGYWVGLYLADSGALCESTQGNPFDCLGVAIAGLVLGLPLLLVLVACVLAGRGVPHAIVGSPVSVFGGTAAVYLVLDLVDYPGPDILGWASCGLAAGAVAAAWAAWAPGRPAAREGTPGHP